MNNCKIFKTDTGMYSITTDITHTQYEENYVIFLIDPKLYETLQDGKNQKELKFLFELHSGNV